MKKTISIIMLMCMLITALVACTDPNGNNAVTTPSGEAHNTTPAGNSEETTSATISPPSQNLGGETVKILAWDDAPNLEFEYDETNLSQITINEAILERNVAVETGLNAKMEFTYAKGNFDNKTIFLTKAESFANGDENEFVDILAAYSMTTALCATKGLCDNLLKYEENGGLNFKNPWWPESLLKQAMFEDTLFFCSGDISTNLLWLMQTMYFNKNLLVKIYGENAPAELYKLSEEGKWTIDKFYEYSTDVWEDLDDNQKKSEGDQFGYCISWNGYYDDFYVGAGFKMIDKDASGKLVISSEWGSEREDTFADTLVDFTYTNDAGLYSSAGSMFTSGKVLFANQRAQFAKTARETAEIDYGILPIPKLDETQEDYCTNVGFGYTLYAISSTSTQPQNASYIIEALAYQSYFIITPVLFEDALKLRYSPEIDDAATFDTLRRTLAFNAGMIFSTPLENYSYSTFRNTISGGSSSYSTKVKANISKVQGLLDTLISDLQKAANITK